MSGKERVSGDGPFGGGGMNPTRSDQRAKVTEEEQEDPTPLPSPPTAVLSRLQSVTSHHASALASVSTISAAASSTDADADTAAAAAASSYNSQPQSQSTTHLGGHPRRHRRRAPTSALATVSHRRSKCPQPPLDSETSLGGASAVSVHHALVAELDLNPAERVPPHRMIPGLSPAAAIASGAGAEGGGGGGGAESAASAQEATRKTIAALSALCDEAGELEMLAQRRILPPLALFGSDLKRSTFDGNAELDDVAMTKRDSELLRRVGKFVPALQETFNFTLRCRRLVRNMVCQIGGCAVPCANPTTDVVTAGAAILGPDVRLVPLAESIAHLLRVLIAIDETVAGNGCLSEGWELFKSVMRDRAIQLQVEEKRDEELESFERLLVQLDFTLLSCRSFVTAIEQNFDPGHHYCDETPSRDRISSTKRTTGAGLAGAGEVDEFNLYGELKAHVTELYERCCKGIGTAEESDEANLAVGVYGMYCLYRRMLPSHLIPDGKLHRSLWMDLPTKRPIIPLFFDASFLPREFLQRYAPYEGLRGCTPSASADPAELRVDTIDRVVAQASVLPAAVDSLRSDSLRWLAAADSGLASYPPSVAGSGVSTKKEEPAVTVENTVIEIVRGIRLARRACTMLRNHLITHSTLDLPIQPEHVLSLMTLCEIVKSVEKLLRVRRRASVVSVQRAAIKMLAASIYRLFESLRLATDQYNVSIDHETSAGSRSIARITACLSSLEDILKGSTTFSLARSNTIAIAMVCCASPSHDFQVESLNKASTLLEELNILSDVDRVTRESCNLSLLYFHSGIFSDFARQFYQNCVATRSFQLVCSAFSDADDELLLLSPPERRDGLQSAQDYRNLMLGVIQEEIIVPICQVIDAEFRLAAFSRSSQQTKQNNPKLDRAAKVRQLLDMPSLCICGTLVSVKALVQEYLESSFYVMSAISLQDNTTYSEMKAIALQFGLKLTDDCLPSRIADSGSDIVHVLSSLPEMVQSHTYDMNQQVFIEKRPTEGTKYLVTVDSHRMASSLQRHGLGIVNHSISVAYKLLWKEFESTSQFFFRHDQLVSLVSKESRWYRENRAECGGCYPFGRAAEFSEEIAKVDDGTNDTSLLERLRILVTHIGNTLAFVRMVCSAEASYSTGARDVVQLSTHKTNVDLPSKTDTTNRNEDLSVKEAICDINNVQQQPHNQLGRKSFLLILSDEFKRDMKAVDYAHMQDFAIIVPALCLNWLETIMRGKEMMHKQNLTSDVYFADDGFALGIAFVISACGQDSSFDALNWFAAIKNKQATDEKSLQEVKAAQEEKDRIAQANQKGSLFPFGRAGKEEMVASENGESNRDYERAALSMSWKMFESRKREMESLFCTLHCSRALLLTGTTSN